MIVPEVAVKPSDPQDLPVFYFGNNVSNVRDQQSNQGYLPYVTLWPRLDTRLSVLHRSCLGVECDHGCMLYGKLTAIDILYIGFFASGLFIFLSAPVFSRSVYFHYSSGVTIGILASLLIVIYVFSRFIPKKGGAVAFVIGGWSLVIYFIRELWDRLFFSEYREYIIAYFVVAGILSFIVCYWYGPVKNERTVHILEGILYLFGSLLIYAGLQHKPTAISFMALLGGITFLTRKGILNTSLRKPRFYWWWKRKWYPPAKKRLMSMEEYEMEGMEETKKALEDLREYCNSPKCNAWKMISKMETPERFAEFVLGDDHLNDNEITLYDSDMSIPPEEDPIENSLFTSDSDSS